MKMKQTDIVVMVAFRLRRPAGRRRVVEGCCKSDVRSFI